MAIVLGVLGLALLGYAAVLFRSVRQGRAIPRSAYLVLLLINAGIVAAVVTWFVSNNQSG